MKQSIVLLTVFVSSLSAMEFQSIGHQSMSMGGAGVASARGSLAGYYNPALLSKLKNSGDLSLGVGAGIRENNIAEQLDELSNIEVVDTLERIAENSPDTNTGQGHNQQEDRDNIIKAKEILKSIGTKNGISVSPAVHLSAKIDNFGVGVYGLGEVSATAHVDTNRLEISVEDPDNPGNFYAYDPISDQYRTIDEDEYNANSLEAAIQEGGTTYVDGKGIVLIEVPVSYAKKYLFEQGELSVGGSLKYMQGTTYTKRFSIDTDSEDSIDDLDDNEKTTSNVGVDLGVIFQPKDLENLSIGLVAKNINSPSFDTTNGSDITIDPQFRTGVAYSINEDVDVALDLDLSSNKTFIPGYDSQNLGGGVNYHPVTWFSLRAGLMSNIANDEEGLIYTAGFGIGHEKFSLDIAAQLSSKSGTYDGEDVPKYSRVNIALTSRW